MPGESYTVSPPSAQIAAPQGAVKNGPDDAYVSLGGKIDDFKEHSAASSYNIHKPSKKANRCEQLS